MTQLGELHDWWTRPCGGREVLRVSLPLVVSEVFGPLRETTVVLLRFVAAYCLFDALNVVFVSAIRGAGGMRFILWTTLATSPPPLLATWWGVTWQGWGLLWCWTVITVWICSLGLIYLARFLQGRWQQMRVIEPDAAA